MKLLALIGKNGQNQFAMVDDEDYEFVSQWKWCGKKDPSGTYVQRTFRVNGKSKTVSLHRMIMKAGSGELVDHADKNTLNNQKSNLRICTKAENNANSKSRKDSTSKYLGVSWNTRTSKWVAAIQKEKVIKHLGYFEDEILAAKAYDKKATELFGKFANLNFK